MSQASPRQFSLDLVTRANLRQSDEPRYFRGEFSPAKTTSEGRPGIPRVWVAEIGSERFAPKPHAGMLFPCYSRNFTSVTFSLLLADLSIC
jgi:hypothetical protein